MLGGDEEKISKYRSRLRQTPPIHYDIFRFSNLDLDQYSLMCQYTRTPDPRFPSWSSFIAVVYRSVEFLSQHVLFKLGLSHPTLGRHGILAANVLLILHILLVCHMLLLFGSHVMRGHSSATARHACLWRRDLRMVHVFRRIAAFLFSNAVLIAGGGLRRIKTGLFGRMVSSLGGVLVTVQQTWMRFLPSGFVTSGWSLGVVNV